MDAVQTKLKIVADRVPVDIEGLRDRIAKAHADNHLWAELSLSQQLKQLIKEALEAAEDKNKKGRKDGSSD